MKAADKLCTALQQSVPCLGGTDSLSQQDLTRLRTEPYFYKFEVKLESLLNKQAGRVKITPVTLSEIKLLCTSGLLTFITHTLSRMPWQALGLCGQLDAVGAASHALKIVHRFTDSLYCVCGAATRSR